jgi:hypothetical protein
MNTPADPWFTSAEEPASAAQVRDLSAQVQALQAQVSELQRRQHRHGRQPLQGLLGFTALPACLLAATIAVGISHRADRAVAPAVPTTAGPGVHVCLDGDFNAPAAACIRETNVVSVISMYGAHLSYTGLGGNAFTSDQLTVTLSRRNDDGSISIIGRFPVETMLSSTGQAVRLQGVFDQVGAMPVPGETYVVEVDEGSADLGTAHFAVTL